MDRYPTSTKNFGYVLSRLPVSDAFGPDLDTAQTYLPARTVARVTNATTPHPDSWPPAQPHRTARLDALGTLPVRLANSEWRPAVTPSLAAPLPDPGS